MRKLNRNVFKVGTVLLCLISAVASTAGPCVANDTTGIIVPILRDIKYVPIWCKTSGVLGDTILINAKSDQIIYVRYGDRSMYMDEITNSEDEHVVYGQSMASIRNCDYNTIAYRHVWKTGQVSLNMHDNIESEIEFVVISSENPERLDVGSLISDPVWSPDGSRLAFTTEFEEYEGKRDVRVLGTIAADGSDVRLYGSTANAGAPVWSPDGTIIAVADGQSVNHPRDLVAFVDWRNGIVKRSIRFDTSGGSIVSEEIEWVAADGSVYFIVSHQQGESVRDRVYVVNAEDATIRYLYGLNDDSLTIRNLDVSPLGGELIYITEPRGWRDHEIFVPSGQLYLLEMKTMQVKVLEQASWDDIWGEPYGRPVFVVGASWSPDGSRIALQFAQESRTGGWAFAGPMLIVMHVDGSKSELLLVWYDGIDEPQTAFGRPIPRFSFVEERINEPAL